MIAPPSPRFLGLLVPAAAAALLTAADAGRVFPHCPPPAPPDCPCPPSPAPQPQPEDAIRRVLDSQADAWNRGDLEGFMAGYWRSPDLTFFSGPDRTGGWQATLDRYRKRYQSDGKEMGKLAFSEMSVEMLGSDHALVRGRWRLELEKEAPAGLFTLVFRRTPDGWRIIHDHTSK